MRILRIVLILLLVIVTAVYCVTEFSLLTSGAGDAPVISCDSSTLELSVKDDPKLLLSGVTAKDRQDGDLTNAIRISGTSKFIDDATAHVNYLVFDSDSNVGTLTRTIRYTDYTAPRITLTEPLIYKAGDEILLLDRIKVEDCIDGDITGSVRVSNLIPGNREELYSVEIQVANSMDDACSVTLPVIWQKDNSSRPQVKLTDYLVYLPLGSSFSPRQYISHVDTGTEIVGKAEVTVEGSVNTDLAGTYLVHYTYPYGNTTGRSILTVVVE